MQYSGKHANYMLAFGKKHVCVFFINFRKKEKSEVLQS